MKMIQSESKKLVSIVAALFVVLFGIMANGCGGGGGTSTVPTVAAPGAPTNFVVVATPAGGDLSATLAWAAPTTGGEPTSYEIYRSDSNDSIFDPANHLISLPVGTF